MASRDKKKTTKAKPAPKAAKPVKKAAKAPAKPAPKPAPAKKSPAPAPKASAPKTAPAKPAPKASAPAAKPVPHAKDKPSASAPAKSGGVAGARPEDKRPNGTVKSAQAAGKPEAPASAGAPGAPGAPGDKKPGPKGITIVQPKPIRKAKPKPKFEMPKSEPLIKPGGKWKPLIPSGPKAPVPGAIGGQNQTSLPMEQRVKTKFNKRELEAYRQILLRKRSELVGDIANMEDEALRQSSGSLSHVPQHMAEQGTDTYDQGLSLDLAAVDRNLLREIDDALKRIEQGTYGICERTGIPIRPERLQEIPWARYSIEAAREMERRPYQE
jgi:RNA polymerase-binding transcription factor DksA